MNTFHVKLGLLCFGFILSTSASSREFSGKIVDMVSWADGHSAISIENGPRNGCPSLYYYSLGVKGQDEKAEPMLSIALSAYMGGREVRINTVDGICQGGQEKITQINILP